MLSDHICGPCHLLQNFRELLPTLSADEVRRVDLFLVSMWQEVSTNLADPQPLALEEIAAERRIRPTWSTTAEIAAEEETAEKAEIAADKAEIAAEKAEKETAEKETPEQEMAILAAAGFVQVLRLDNFLQASMETAETAEKETAEKETAETAEMAEQIAAEVAAEKAAILAAAAEEEKAAAYQ